MSHELFYTSASQGLLPGSSGFCVVSMTDGLPATISERLEGLSGYRQLYPPGDPSVENNPVVYSHLKLSFARTSYQLLSRIAYSGLDYTDRSNKFAHHVLLNREECPQGGPAWLASHDGFLEMSWDGVCRFISQGRKPPQGDLNPEICTTWRERFGDAGWAGVVAERFLTDPSRLVYIVFDPGQDVLPLFVEASALIPPQNRWEICFSTYFTGQIHGLQCSWRAVARDSQEAIQARRLPDTLIFDSKESIGEPDESPLVLLGSV